MENLVQAWLVRVEHYSAEVSRKRAALNGIRRDNLHLKAAAEEDQHLLADKSKYLCDLSLQKAQLAQKVIAARSETPSLGNSSHCGSLSDRSCHQSIPNAATERLHRVISKEKAQMAAYDALAEQAHADAREAQRRMQQELDQVVACTRSTEEQTRQADAAMARSLVEKHAHAEECEGLQKELSRVVENNKRLEQDVLKLEAYAVKRAQNKSKVTETENGDLRKAQGRRDAALARLTQVQHSNAEVEWRLHALNRQILDAQGAVQQLCL